MKKSSEKKGKKEQMALMPNAQKIYCKYVIYRVLCKQ